MNLKSILLLSILLSTISFSQSFRFNRYTAEDGMAQDFIYSINQDAGGYLWIGTGEGLSRFDGRSFVEYNSEADGLAEDVITCSYVDEKGEIWFGHNEGGLTHFNHSKFTAIKNDAMTTSTVNSICGIGDTIFFVSQNDGLFQLVDYKIQPIGKFDRENFQAIGVLDKENLLLATAAGLLHLKNENGEWNVVKTEFENEWFTDIKPSYSKEYLLAVTNSGRLIRFRIKDGALQKSAWDDFDLGELDIQSVMQDADLNVWLATSGQGLIKLHMDTLENPEAEKTYYNISTGLSSDYVQSVFQDREGNIWIGTFGKGLSTLIDDFFTFYDYDPEKFGSSISAIWMGENDQWIGLENGLLRVSPKLKGGWKFYTDTTGLIRDKITALHQIDSVLWIGTETKGVYQFDLTTNQIRRLSWSYSKLENRIHAIQGNRRNLWFATGGGLIRYGTSDGKMDIYNTENGLPHNSIKTIFQDGKTLWLGTHSRQLYKIVEGKFNSFEISTEGEIEVVDIAKDNSGDIWLATERTGVYVFEGDGFRAYSTKNGLKSNYCYAIEKDSRGYMWVGHRGAMSRISPKTEDVKIYDHNSGIDDQINERSMLLDNKNYLWIGTDGGLVKYDPSKDKKSKVPPVINLLKIIINDREYSIKDEVKLPYGNYRVTFEYIGISFSAPEDVTYQYKLEGYDRIFSDPTEAASQTYGNISDGTYVFKVIACTDGTCSETAAQKIFIIGRPFWKTWWFISLAVIIFSSLIVFIVQVRLRRLKRIQVYLKTQLDIKTKEVVDKAEQIAEINKDLTASINYAERIQQSILPKSIELSENLPNSFIFFRPRDIVSGDFYYVEKIENKLIVVCADCTGHGVPGAFMSMIGSVAIRNIYEIMEITGVWQTPEKVLEDLDREVEIVLKQTEEEELDPVESFFKSRDGMDLTICEINLDTHEVLLSSAMRTSLIRQDGVVSMIGGDKRPIGGGESRGIDFTLKKFQMKKGDALFLFSDGYSDQFGGENGRKLKLLGVQHIVENLHVFREEEYEHMIALEFDKWKEDMDQIDDVLFMGLLF